MRAPVGDVDAFGRGTDHSVFIADAFNNPPNATNLVAPSPGTELVIDGALVVDLRFL